MQLKIQDVYTNDFVFNYLRNVMLKRFRYYNQCGNFIAMDNYLKKLNKKFNTLDIWTYAIKHPYASVENNFYILSFDTNYEYRDYKISQLLNLIEYGNLEVKGTHIFNAICNFIKYYCDTYFDKYLKGDS